MLPKRLEVLTDLARLAGGGVSLLMGKCVSGVVALLGEEVGARGSSFTADMGGDAPGPIPVAAVTTTAAGAGAEATATAAGADAAVAAAEGIVGVTAELGRGRGDDATGWGWVGGGDAVPLRSWRRLSFL